MRLPSRKAHDTYYMYLTTTTTTTMTQDGKSCCIYITYMYNAGGFRSTWAPGWGALGFTVSVCWVEDTCIRIEPELFFSSFFSSSSSSEDKFCPLKEEELMMMVMMMMEAAGRLAIRVSSKGCCSGHARSAWLAGWLAGWLRSLMNDNNLAVE
jgi:hypothetical protein